MSILMTHQDITNVITSPDHVTVTLGGMDQDAMFSVLLKMMHWGIFLANEAVA